MAKVRLVPVDRGRRYECFECGVEIVAPFSLSRCPKCREQDNFHLMD